MFYSDDPAQDYEDYCRYCEEQENKDEDYEWDKEAYEFECYREQMLIEEQENEEKSLN